MTFYYITLKSFLSWVRIGIVGEGTAVGDAIAVSLKRLKDQTTKSKIIEVEYISEEKREITLIEKEVKFLSAALSPAKPYVVILGGAKVSDKVKLILKKSRKYLQENYDELESD